MDGYRKCPVLLTFSIVSIQVVGGSKISKNFADVIYGRTLTPCSHSASKKINLLTNQIISCDAFFKNLMYATGALNRILLDSSVAKTYPIAYQNLYISESKYNSVLFTYHTITRYVLCTKNVIAINKKLSC